MELSRGKRILLGISFLAVVIFSFLGGYLLAKVKPSNYISNNSKNEIINILDKYYYSDYDKNVFETESLKAGVDSLNDPYTYLYNTYETRVDDSYYGYGIGTSDSALGLKVTKVYKNSPAAKVGLAIGDYIIGVDDIRIGDEKIDDISNHLKEAKEDVKLHVLRNMKEFNVTLKKELVMVSLVSYSLIGEVGYIKIESFDEGASKAFKEVLKTVEDNNIKGRIIDVRNNPGGLASEVSSILRCFLTGSDAFLYLKAEKGKNPEIYRATNATKKSYDIKVLMNENSASASEVFAFAMNKVMNYELIGTHSFGKNVYQTDFKLSSMENTYLHVTLGHWYGPNNEMITNEGITPTIEVVDNKYIPLPISEDECIFETACDDCKNICLMLNEMHNANLRTDGYFDSTIQTFITTNYESDKLDYNTKKKIFDAYYEYVNKEENDKVLVKALSLFE